MWIVGPFMRYFDFKSAARVDKWIANSNEVARRIEKFYRKQAKVIYPPISVAKVDMKKRGDYYLMISRIVGGKGISEAAKAFKQLGIKLKVVGEVVDIKLGREVESIGRVDDANLAELYARAKGFVALARDEDFGMTVVESMMYGTPVLAYHGGGYLETVISGKTGIFTDGVEVKDIKAAVEQMEKIKWSREQIIEWASKFGKNRFEKEIRKVVGV